MPVSRNAVAAGTLIRTPDGDRPVEDLAPGDLVDTAANGPQPLSYIARFAPEAAVIVDSNILGNGRPLTLSPEARVQVSDWRAELFYGRPSVILSVETLIDGVAVRHAPQVPEQMFALSFRTPQTVIAEGTACACATPGRDKPEVPQMPGITCLSNAEDIATALAARAARPYDIGLLTPEAELPRSTNVEQRLKQPRV